MKQKTMAASAFLAALFILNTSGTVSAQEESLTPALEVLSEDIGFSKCTVTTKEIKFTRTDFEETFGSPLQSVTVTSLPSAETGTLKYAGSAVYEGQTIPCSNLSLMKFVPSGNVGSTSFSVFADNKDELFVTCRINITEKYNNAPVARDAEVSAISGISAVGSFDIRDPDGDEMTICISGYPKSGVVKINGNGYVYTSVPNFYGSDSFTYTVRDKYGNVSESASVSFDVRNSDTDIRYDDMNGHWGYTGALTMTELGLMNGEKNGEVLNFNPDSPVTRGDFLAMAMICAGLESEITPGAATTFADDTSIPFNIRSYASYAEAGGIISGYRNELGHKVFAGGNEITRAEAASVLSNLLGKASSPAEFNYTDAASIPEWAREDFAILTSCGIINGDNEGKLEPMRSLTRAEAAQMLCRMREQSRKESDNSPTL